MSFKPFFVHTNLLKYGHEGRKLYRTNGFTAYIQPHEKNPRELKIQITQCTGKDEFCRKIGREQAQLAETLVINKRDVASVLAEADAYAHGWTIMHNESAYMWVFKYVV